MRRAIFTTMVARTQHWSSAKKLLVVIPAVLFIAAHGFLIAWGSMNLSGEIGGWFPWIAGGALLAFGLYHVIPQFRKGHGASHSFETHRPPV